MQIWPALRNERRTAPAAARSRSAWRETSIGQLPPSSSVSRVTPDTVLKSRCPVALEPVKAILAMPGCAASRPPTSPAPCTTLTTPGGKPASRMHSASTCAAPGVYSDGLTTIVQPGAERAAELPADQLDAGSSTA